QDGRRRFHPQAVLAAASGRTRKGRAAPLAAEGPDRRAEGERRQGARSRPAQDGSGATYLHLEERARDVDGDRIPDPAGGGDAPGRGEEPQRVDGRRL